MLYRRANAAGATYFFTVNLADRNADTLVRHVDALRMVINRVKKIHPFSIVAMVVLPEHLHAIWRLPVEDANYPTRWALIKSGFSRLLPKTERIASSRATKRERGIWQRRYWEHQICDDDDLAQHVHYIHYNPVKHGLAAYVSQWPYSTYHRYVADGTYPADWAGNPALGIGRGGE